MNYFPLLISLNAALISTIINLFLGIYGAYFVSKSKKFKGVIDGLLTLPLVLPPTVVGFFLLILLGKNSIIGKILLKFDTSIMFSKTATIISATVVSFPLMYRTARGAFEQFDKNLIYVGKTLGLSEHTIFKKIILPNNISSIIAGTILTFARSLGEFGATIMIAGNIPGKTQTMSVAIYSAVQGGNRQLAYKWVALMASISFFIIVLMNIFESEKSIYWCFEGREVLKILYVKAKKTLGDFKLDIEFEINNSTLALLGPSGCGKSMTLKCIAGIETPDEGEIVLNGKTLFNDKKRINILPQNRRIGLLFQNYSLFPNMTLKENIFIGIRKEKKGKEKIVKQMIKDFSLDGLEDNYPHQLSGGQQQRVALARMIVNEPEILMLDEPLSALDEHLKWQMECELIDIINRHTGETIYVSHNKNEVFRISDLVAVINNGKIEEFSNKSNLFSQPNSIYSAILTGYKNISRAKKINENRVLAIDWNLELECENIKDDIKYIAIHEQDIDICNYNDSENIFKFNIVNIIKNIQSNIAIVSNSKTLKPYIYIELPRNSLNQSESSFYIRFNKDKLRFFY